MEESASHHLIIIAFAQLRAEETKNNVRGPRRILEMLKIWILEEFEKIEFCKYFWALCRVGG